MFFALTVIKHGVNDHLVGPPSRAYAFDVLSCIGWCEYVILIVNHVIPRGTTIT